MRRTELEKIDTLEDKIKTELAQLADRSEQMRKQIETFVNVGGAGGEGACCVLLRWWCIWQVVHCMCPWRIGVMEGGQPLIFFWGGLLTSHLAKQQQYERNCCMESCWMWLVCASSRQSQRYPRWFGWKHIWTCGVYGHPCVLCACRWLCRWVTCVRRRRRRARGSSRCARAW